MRTASILRGALAIGLLGAAVASAQVTPRQKCWQGKNNEVAKYASCRQKSEAKFALTSDAAVRDAALAKCLAKFGTKWPLLESKADSAGDPCPTTGDQLDVQAVIDDATSNVANALAGTGELLGPGRLVRTGQAQCWNTAGAPVPCGGTGHDGELQKGIAPALVDNGDGTVTDGRTGLVWEKLTGDGTIHDQDATYTWANAFAVKIAALNAGGGFAGHTDWRVPNVRELQSIAEYGLTSPSVAPELHTGCVPGCDGIACACTFANNYWTSSTYQVALPNAWYVNFNSGFVNAGLKTLPYRVRAVRGGP